jgi:hypothetical protein
LKKGKSFYLRFFFLNWDVTLTLSAPCLGTTSAPSAALWRAWKGKAAAEERGKAGGRGRIQGDRANSFTLLFRFGYVRTAKQSFQFNGGVCMVFKGVGIFKPL